MQPDAAAVFRPVRRTPAAPDQNPIGNGRRPSAEAETAWPAPVMAKGTVNLSSTWPQAAETGASARCRAITDHGLLDRDAPSSAAETAR